MDAHGFAQLVPQFIASLDASVPVLPALAAYIQEISFPPVSLATKIEIWVLFGLHAIVLFLSGLGLWERHLSGNLWFFKRGSHSAPSTRSAVASGDAAERGLWHPNTAVVTQTLFMVYCILWCSVQPCYSLRRFPTVAAFVAVNVCYIPLGVAFHCMCWSTALAPTTSLSFLLPPKSKLGTSTRRLGPALINISLIFSVILFVLSTIPGAVCIVIATRQMTRNLDTLTNTLLQAGPKGLDGPMVQTLSSLGDAITRNVDRTEVIFKIQVGVYLAWAVVWLSIYVPTSLRLISTLVSRRRRLLRTLNSLQKLDEIVTQDEEELKSSLSKEPPRLTPSPTATVRPPPRANIHRPIDWKDIVVPSPPSTANSAVKKDFFFGSAPPQLASNSHSKKVLQARHFAERMLEEVGISDQPAHDEFGRSESRAADEVNRSARLGMLDSKRSLGQTSRLLAIVGVQFCTTILMAGSYLAFCFAVVSDRLSNIRVIYIPWTSWTFIVPALLSSATFYFLSSAATRSSRPQLSSHLPSSTQTSPTLHNPTQFTDESIMENKSPLSEASSRFSGDGFKHSPVTSATFPPNRMENVFHVQLSESAYEVTMQQRHASLGEIEEVDTATETARLSSVNGWVPSVWAEEQERKRKDSMLSPTK